jgi:hypothetical protein
MLSRVVVLASLFARVHVLLVSVLILYAATAGADVVVPGPRSSDTRDLWIGGSMFLCGVIGIIVIRMNRRVRER